jgi:iron complex outermembrane receptor protein
VDDWVTTPTSAGPTQELEGYHDNAARVQLLVAPIKDLSVLLGLHARDLRARRACSAPTSSSPAATTWWPVSTATKVSSTDGKSTNQGEDRPAPSRRQRARGLCWAVGHGAAARSPAGRRWTPSAGATSTAASARSFLGAGNFGPGNIPFASESADGLPKHRQLTQELRLESARPGPLSTGWPGVYYFDEDYNIDSFSYDSHGRRQPQDGYQRTRQKNKAYAACSAAVNLAGVAGGFKLRGGLRYTQGQEGLRVEAYRVQGSRLRALRAAFGQVHAGATGGHRNPTATCRPARRNKTSGDFSAPGR